MLTHPHVDEILTHTQKKKKKYNILLYVKRSKLPLNKSNLVGLGFFRFVLLTPEKVLPEIRSVILQLFFSSCSKYVLEFM